MKIKVFVAFAVLVLFVSLAGVVAAEPTLESVLDTLGFTDRTLAAVETFPSGKYEISLYAEYAGFRDSNQMRWYKTGTSDFNLIFDGPEGVPPGDPMGLVTPALTKTLTINDQFGLSMLSPDGTWYTETSRNSDGKQHATIYQSLANPHLFYIGFENRALGPSDFDFNDMIISLEFIPPPPSVGGEWISVSMSGLLTPWISLTAAITILTALFVNIRRMKKRKDWAHRAQK